jgi:hypothetical protein
LLQAKHERDFYLGKLARLEQLCTSGSAAGSRLSAVLAVIIAEPNPLFPLTASSVAATVDDEDLDKAEAREAPPPAPIRSAPPVHIIKY